MYKIVEFSHLLIEQFYNNNNKGKNLVFIDATCGRGNDTLKLAETLNHTGTIVAYDIQNEAIKDTKLLLEQNGFSNIVYHNTSHDNLFENDFDLIIYNLGYLPGSNKQIKTTSTTTLKSINQALSKVASKEDFLIIIVIYPGHPEGKEESMAIDKFCYDLPAKQYLVSKYQNYNRPTSPYIVTISPNKINKK